MDNRYNDDIQRHLKPESMNSIMVVRTSKMLIRFCLVWIFEPILVLLTHCASPPPACTGKRREQGKSKEACFLPGKTFRLALACLGKNLTAIFYAPFSSRTTFLNTPCTVAFFSNTHRGKSRGYEIVELQTQGSAQGQVKSFEYSSIFPQTNLEK